MAGAGFSRRENQYFHSRARFYVEFPPGPLSIGKDYGITPVEIHLGRKVVLGLSATDSCRDRLASYFHWNDREGLRAAIAIVQRGKVDLEKIASWAHQEGALAAARHETFLAELQLARRRRRPRNTAPAGRGRSGES